MGDMHMVPMMRTYPWCHPHSHGELLVVPVMGGCPQWGKLMVPTMGGCPGWRKLMVMGRCPRWGHAHSACSREVLVVPKGKTQDEERSKMGRCQYEEVFVVSTMGNAYSGEMMVVLMTRRCPWWGGAHSAHEGRCPHWGHAQGACNGEVFFMLTMGRYPLVMPLMGRCL